MGWVSGAAIIHQPFNIGIGAGSGSRGLGSSRDVGRSMATRSPPKVADPTSIHVGHTRHNDTPILPLYTSQHARELLDIVFTIPVLGLPTAASPCSPTSSTRISL